MHPRLIFAKSTNVRAKEQLKLYKNNFKIAFKYGKTIFQEFLEL